MTPLEGEVAEGFEPVREAFRQVVAKQNGSGAAMAAWHEGRWVADLYGGYVDAARTRPWSVDSIVMPYSVTKPFAAVCLLVLVDRGLVALDESMQTYWPELVAPATVRQVLSHQAAGIVALDDPLPTEAFYDWNRKCATLAAQEPQWQPGERHGESALFYGHLVGEVVRRVDGRSLGQFLRDEICGSLGLDFAVGLTASEQTRAVELTGLTDEAFRRQVLGTRTPLYERAANNPPGASDPAVVNSPAWRAAEIPAVNGHGSARAVCELFVALLDSRLLSSSLREEMATTHCSGLDAVMGAETAWGLGVAVDADGFGMGGTGGNLGWRAGRAAMPTGSSRARSASTTGPTSSKAPSAHASGSRLSSEPAAVRSWDADHGLTPPATTRECCRVLPSTATPPATPGAGPSMPWSSVGAGCLLLVGIGEVAEFGFAVGPDGCAFWAGWGSTGSGGLELASGDLEECVAVQIGEVVTAVVGAGAAFGHGVLVDLALDYEAGPLRERIFRSNKTLPDRARSLHGPGILAGPLFCHQAHLDRFREPGRYHTPTRLHGRRRARTNLW
jgi:CubicO group peptidase (beta-lactamase class C family)